MTERGGKPRGFGFVRFRDESAAAAALAVKHTLCGRVVDAKRCVSREVMARHDRPLPPSKAPPPTKLHVSGLSLATTDDAFRTFFERFGNLSESLVLQDGTGSSRGFGFVQFEREEDAAAVLASPQLELEGHKLNVKRAEPRRDDRPALASGVPAPRGGRMGYDRGGDTSYGGRRDAPYGNAPVAGYSQQPFGQMQPASASGWTTYVPSATQGLAPQNWAQPAPVGAPGGYPQQTLQQPSLAQWAPQAAQPALAPAGLGMSQPSWLATGLMAPAPVASSGAGVYGLAAAPPQGAGGVYGGAGYVQQYMPPGAPGQQQSWSAPPQQVAQQPPQQQQAPAYQYQVAPQLQYGQPQVQQAQPQQAQPADPRRSTPAAQPPQQQQYMAPVPAAASWGGVPTPAFNEAGQPTWLGQGQQAPAVRKDARYAPY
jgi:RNA-binding protein Musashi